MSASLRLARLDALPDTTASDRKAPPDVLRGLHDRDPGAQRWLVTSFRRLIERTLLRITGDFGALDDQTQEVFARVFRRMHDVVSEAALPSFIRSVAVLVAREALRKRRRHRWLTFRADAEVPEITCVDDPEAREGLRSFYALLTKLDADDRIAFVLRAVEGLELKDVAEACGVSVATAKRRIARAEAAFVAHCRSDEVLSVWLERGGRWT